MPYPLSACRGSHSAKPSPEVLSAEVAPTGDVLTITFTVDMDQSFNEDTLTVTDVDTNDHVFSWVEWTTGRVATFSTLSPVLVVGTLTITEEYPGGQFRDLSGALLPTLVGLQPDNLVPL